MADELIVLDNINPLQIFGTPQGLDPFLDKIEAEVRKEVYDISTEEGRLRVGSVARKIGSAKSRLKEMALGLTEDWRKQTQAVTSERTRMEARLDSLRDEIKAPLDEFKEREKKRVDDHEATIKAMNDLMVFDFDPPSVTLAERIATLPLLEMREWGEFLKRATDTASLVRENLKKRLDSALLAEHNASEVARLKKKEDERLQRERDEQLKRDAADKARKEAEEKAASDAKEAANRAAVETKRLEDEKDAADLKAKQADEQRIATEKKAKEDAEAAELARIAAMIKAEQDAKDAAARERKRIEDEQAKQVEETRKREADMAHKAKIHNAIKDALQKILYEGPPDGDPLKALVIALAKGQVPHVKVEY